MVIPDTTNKIEKEKIMKKLLIVAAAALAVTAAQADGDSKWYGVAGLGTASVKSDISDMSASSGTLSISQTVDTKGNSFLGGIGYQFDDQLAFEAQYLNITGFGASQSITATNAVVNGSTINGTITANQDVSAKAYAFSAKYDWKLDSASKVYARAGFTQVKVTNDIGVSGTGTIGGTAANVKASLSFDETKTVPLFGIGYEYDLSKTLAMRAEYTRIDTVGKKNTTGESAVDMLTLQTKFKF